MDNLSNKNVPVDQTSEQENNGISLRELWGLFLANWKWFALSVAICMLAATYYILKTTPSYVRSASVLIKEDRKSGTAALDISQSFSNLGFGQLRVNVNNEILNFTSPDLMLQVVRNLDLDVSYKAKGLFHDYPLYGSSLPMTVRFLSLSGGDRAAVTVSPVDSGKVKLSGFVLNGVDLGSPGTDATPSRAKKFVIKLKRKVIESEYSVVAAYGDTVCTPVGMMTVNRDENVNIAPFTEPVYVTRIGYQATARSCSARLSAGLSEKEATVIALSYRDVNVQRADDVLAMVINVYNENWIKDKNTLTNATNEFIAERLAIIESELGSVDESITSFRSSHRIPDSRTVAQMDMQLSAEAGKQLLELNNQLSIARFLQGDIRNASYSSLLPANVGINDPNTMSLINQYNSLMLQRNRLVENSSEENLLVKDLDVQLASMRTAIQTSLSNYIKSVEIQISSSQRAQQSSEARVSNIPIQTGRLLSDERQQKVKEALYLYLLQKREENELSQAFTAYNTRIVASPGGSSSPVAPNKKMIWLVALIFGLGFPFAFFYLRETLNTTLRGRKDLENLSAPFLGELPSIEPKKRLFKRASKKDERSERAIVVKPRSRNVINEAFRVVRTNMEFMHGKSGGCQVVMFTSFNVASGKTFIASNLGVALAIRGRKVLAIDLDLRKHTLSMFAKEAKLGVSDYLSGRVPDFRPLIVKGASDTALDILPVGTTPPNPAELLSEERLGTMLDALRSEYDYIFLDCPPIEIVTDADLVAPLVDTTVFVLRAGLMERSMLPQIERFYLTKRYPNIAMILNGTESAGHYGTKYGYRYGYKYGYKYGYGTGNYGGSDDSEEETAEA